MARPFRLDPHCYSGLHAYFVTACTLDRQLAFVEQSFCARAHAELLAYSARHMFAVVAYCLMPDHVHLLLRAVREDADPLRMVAAWKQRTGFAWSRRCSRRLWQKGCWDRTLRAEEHLLPVARYIVENPVRAGMVSHVRDYQWVGSEDYTVEQIMQSAQMDLRRSWHR